MSQTETGSNVVSARPILEAQRAELADRVARYATQEGPQDCAVPGLVLVRASAPSHGMPTVYHPSLCVVVQGRKQAQLADEVYVYDPLNYLVVSMTLPMVGQILEATPERPYLCLRIDIDPMVVNELVLQLGSSAPPPPSDGRALFVARTDAPLLDAMLRLVRLLDTPREAGVLAPLILREIQYRVLTGELGQRLRELCRVEGPSQRIAQVIERLKTHFAEPLRIDALAASVHMSPSSLYERFKAATAMTPLQFQKQLRLQEARRLMLTEGLDAAAAGYRVGYESASQFSREYRRLFGAPPRREIEAVRRTLP